MDWLTSSWWAWLGIGALLFWAFARYRRAPMSQHAHADAGAHGDTGHDAQEQAHGGHGGHRHGGCC